MSQLDYKLVIKPVAHPQPSILLMLTSTATAVHTKDLLITLFEQMALITLEPAAKLLPITSQIKITLNINARELLTLAHNITEEISYAKQYFRCVKALTVTTNCSIALEEFESQAIEQAHILASLFTVKHRPKRGLNFLGTILHELTGWF